MKTLLTLFVMLFSLTQLTAQNSLETQSVALEDLITFVANQFPAQNIQMLENSQSNERELKKSRQISFVLETPKRNFSSEDRIMLQQAFKFLSTRLNKEDAISLLVYSGQNGLLLDRISAKDIKKMLSAIYNVQKSITEKHKDGIAMTYKLAQENYNTAADNMVVMVRNPNATKDSEETNQIEVTTLKAEPSKNKTGNVVLLTAITLLPELISIIKD